MRSNPSGRVIGAGLAAVAVAGTAAITMTTAPANATVDALSSSSTTPVVGGTYTLSADLSGTDSSLPVVWADNGVNLNTPAETAPFPAGHSSVTWKPTTAGPHVITLTQGSSTKPLILTVADTTVPTPTYTPPTPANPAQPTTTAPATTQPNSGGTGSGGSGSGTGSATGSAGSLISGLLRGLLGSS
ncbi:hypothetical protein [Nocardia sp. NPDC004722]